MKIIVDDKWWVDHTELEFTLYKKVKVADKDSKNYGKTIDRIEGHYISLPAALQRIIHVNLAENNKEVTLKEYIDEYRNERDRVTKMF